MSETNDINDGSHSHPTTSRDITVESTVVYGPTIRCWESDSLSRPQVPTQIAWDILRLLLQRKLVELLSKGELPIHSLLSDVEPLHVEEAIFADGFDEGLRKLFVAFRGAEASQVNGDEIGPV